MTDIFTSNDLPEDLWPAVAVAMREQLANGSAAFEIIGATGGYIYDRKGFAAVDVFGQPRNPRYSSATDDLVLSLSIRFDRRAAVDQVKAAQVKANELAKAELDEKIKAAAEEARAAQERLAVLQQERNKR